MNPQVLVMVYTPAEDLQIKLNQQFGTGRHWVYDNNDGTARVGPENNAIWTYRIADALKAFDGDGFDAVAFGDSRIPMKRISFNVVVTVEMPDDIVNPGIVCFKTPQLDVEIPGARVVDHETDAFYTLEDGTTRTDAG